MAFDNIPMNLTLKTLAEIDFLSEEEDKDLLSVETNGGKTYLTTIKQSNLSYLGKKWAWMGFKSTSLKQVSQFLNSAEGKKQLEELEQIGNFKLAEKVIENIRTLNEKIEDIEKPRRELLQPNFIRVIKVRLCQLIHFFMNRSVQIPLSLIDHLEKISLKIEKTVREKQHQEEKDKLQADYDAQCEELESLMEELEEKEDKIQTLSSKKEKSIDASEQDKMEAEWTKLRKQEALLKKQFEEFAKYRMDTEEGIAQAKKELQESVDKSQKALEKKQARLLDLEERQKALEESEFALIKKLLSFEDEKKEMSQLRQHVKEIETEKASLESTSKKIEQQLKDLKSKTTDSALQKQQYDQDIAQLQNTLEQKAKELAQLERKHQNAIKEKDELISKNRIEIGELQEKLDNSKINLRSQYNAWEEKNYALQDVQWQLNQLKSTLDQKEKSCSKALADKEEAEKKLQDYKQTAQFTDLSAMQKLSTNYEQAKRIIIDKEKEIALARQEVIKLEKQWQTAYNDGKKAEFLLQTKQQEIADVNQSLLEKQNQLHIQEQQRKELVQQNALTVAEKQKLEKQLQDSQSQLKLIEEQFAKSKSTLSQLEVEKNKAEQNWREWYKIAQDKDKILTQKEAEYTQHAIKLDQLKDKCAQEQSKIVGEKLDEIKAKHEKEIQEHEKQLASLQKQKQHAESQWKVCYDGAEKVRLTLIDLQKQHLTEKQTNQQLLQEQSKMQQTLLELQSQLKSMQAREKELTLGRESLLKEKRIVTEQLIQTRSEVENLAQTKRQSQQNLDDHLRELIGRQLDLPKSQELNQIAEATRKILETAMVEALKDGKGQLKLADFQKIEHFAEVARQQANLVAIRDFFVNIEQDNSIGSDVKQLLKDEWNKKEGGIFGKEVKDNQEFFSSMKRAAILKKAKEWSQTKEDLKQSLEQFQKQLNSDISLGKFIPVATHQVRKRYGDYFALSKQLKDDMPSESHAQLEIELQKEFQKICNAALINREIQRKNNKKEVGSLVEDLILEQLGYSDVKTDESYAKRKQAELDVLKILLQGKGIEETPIENLQNIVKKEKCKARLEAVLSAKDQANIKQIHYLIETLEKEYLVACTTNEERNKSSIDKEIDEALPAQTKGFFLRSKSEIVDLINQHELENVLKEQKDAIRRLVAKNPKYIEQSIQMLIDELCGKMYSGELYEDAVEKILGKKIEFYKNWMDNLVSMVQGYDDENKVLGKGTCFAISTQLGMKEQNGDFDPVVLGGKGEDYAAEVGDVKSIHRFRQALLGVSWQQADKPQSDVTSALFGPTVSKALKVKGATTAFVLTDPNIASGDFDKALKTHATDLASAKGVGIISFWMKNGGAHAIYVRYDQVNKIYRLFDPNVGGITFKTESQLFYCFKDLIQTFYGDLTKIYCHRMNK